MRAGITENKNHLSCMTESHKIRRFCCAAFFNVYVLCFNSLTLSLYSYSLFYNYAVSVIRPDWSVALRDKHPEKHIRERAGITENKNHLSCMTESHKIRRFCCAAFFNVYVLCFNSLTLSLYSYSLFYNYAVSVIRPDWSVALRDKHPEKHIRERAGITENKNHLSCMTESHKISRFGA